MADPEYYLYEIVDDGVVLYVGQSQDPKARFKQHQKTKKFPKSATMRIVRRFLTRDGALLAEELRIKELWPNGNQVHNEALRVHQLAEERRTNPLWAYKAMWSSRNYTTDEAAAGAVNEHMINAGLEPIGPPEKWIERFGPRIVEKRKRR